MGKKKADKKGLYNCVGKCDCRNERVNVDEKIKVKNLEIIVTGTEEKPYYEIKYESLVDGLTHIGYSSFDLKNVFKWKQEHFEVVEVVKERTGKRYRVIPKKRPIIEAFQYDGGLKNSKGEYYVPVWAEEAFESGKLYYDTFIPGEQPYSLYIMGINNMPIRVRVGDYIVKDDSNRIYNMAPENFENVFEEVAEL